MLIVGYWRIDQHGSSSKRRLGDTAVQTGQTYVGHRDADIVLLEGGRLGRGSLDEVDVLGDKALVGGHVCSSEYNPLRLPLEAFPITRD